MFCGVEAAINKFKGAGPPLPEAFQGSQEMVAGHMPDPFIQRGETELTAKGTAAGGLYIAEAVGKVILTVEVVGKLKVVQLRGLCCDEAFFWLSSSQQFCAKLIKCQFAFP